MTCTRSSRSTFALRRRAPCLPVLDRRNRPGSVGGKLREEFLVDLPRHAPIGVEDELLHPSGVEDRRIGGTEFHRDELPEILDGGDPVRLSLARDHGKDREVDIVLQGEDETVFFDM